MKDERDRLHVRYFIGLLFALQPAIALTMGASALLGESWVPKVLGSAAWLLFSAAVYPLLRSGKGLRAMRGIGVLTIAAGLASFFLLGNWSLFFSMCAVVIASTVVRSRTLAIASMAALVGHGLLAWVGPSVVLSNEESWSAGFGGLLLVSTTSLVYRGHCDRLRAWERHQAQRLELRRRRLFALAFDGFLVADGDSIADVNPGLCRIFMRRRADIVGSSLLKLFAEDAQGRIRGVLEGSVTGSIEVRGIRGDGEVRELELVVQHEPGTVSSSYIAVRDVTRRKKAEARLSIADRAVSTGTLAAGVAHEINNPLSYLMTNLSLVDAALRNDADADPDELRRSIKEAQEGAQRVRSVVADLRSLSRPQDEERVPTDVEEALELAIRMAQRSIEMRAKLVRTYEPKLPPALAQGARLGQVFLNLLNNAAQAIPEGDAANNQIEIRTRLEGSEIVVEVEDTGVGMTAEVARRVFDPFFTTKRVNEGTGLGLSIVRGIVVSFGGRIELDSKPNVGTVVRVRLPATVEQQATPAEAVPEWARSDLAAGRARILIVDDERLVGSSLARALAGHQVTSVESGAAALEEARDRKYDLVICDLMMPDVGGADLHARFVVEQPDLAKRMIFITGGAFTPATQAFLADVENPVLEKPFDLATLRETVAGVLREARGGDPKDAVRHKKAKRAKS